MPARRRSRFSRIARCGLVATVVLMLSACGALPRSTPSSSQPASAPPASPTPSPTRNEAVQLVSKMSVREQVTSVLMLHTAGTDTAAMSAFVRDTKVGGLIMMGDNVGDDIASVATLADAAQTARAASEPPRLLAVDQEGGDVSRLPGDVWPAGADLATAPVSATTAAFAARGTLVKQAHLNTNFGVVADVTTDSSSFIASRVLGTTPSDSAPRVTAAVTAETNAGVLSVLKHFPGHGAAPGDSHSSLPSTSMPLAQWKTTDALPFQAGIDAGAPMVMLGHLAYTAVDAKPASLSPRWHQILREDMGFKGLIVSDDLGMLENSGIPAYSDRVRNGVAALNAGTSLLLYVADGPTPMPNSALIDGLVAAANSGTLSKDALQDAAERVMAVRLQLR